MMSQFIQINHQNLPFVVRVSMICYKSSCEETCKEGNRRERDTHTVKKKKEKPGHSYSWHTHILHSFCDHDYILTQYYFNPKG